MDTMYKQTRLRTRRNTQCTLCCIAHKGTDVLEFASKHPFDCLRIHRQRSDINSTCAKAPKKRIMTHLTIAPSAARTAAIAVRHQRIFSNMQGEGGYISLASWCRCLFPLLRTSLNAKYHFLHHYAAHYCSACSR